MSYTTAKYPASFGILKPDTRQKAINIANRLIEKGLDRKTADIIALCNAREMAHYARSTSHAYVADCSVHVVPYPGGWAMLSSDASMVFYTFSKIKDAIIRARSYAKSMKSKLYVHSESGFIIDSENFIVNMPVSGRDRLPVPRAFF